MKNFIFSVSLFAFLFVLNTGAIAADKPYHIAPGDILEISVWKDPNLSRQLVVPPDGIISFPLIEAIDVKNLTVADLEKIVTQKLSEFVPDVTVTVMLTEINSLKAYVIGKVERPGEFPINMNTNVMQVLAMAGGLNAFASKSGIIILRYDNNKIIKIPFDYGDIEKGKNLEQNFVLMTGDVVVVP